MPETVAVIGTLDTKALEIRYLADLIHSQGCRTLIVDVGVFAQEVLVPDISRAEVAAGAETTPAAILESHDRSYAVKTMMQGGAAVLKQRSNRGEFTAVIALGGGTGTHITAGIMRALPTGIPKLIVSTVASRDMSPVIGSKDITVMHSVADLAGLNFMTRKILADAAGAIVGMVRSPAVPVSERPVVGLTSFGPLNECASISREMLAGLGYEVVPFHAIGSGSVAMEDLVDQGAIQGVLDLALHEFADQMYHGYCGRIGRDRLETPGRKGVPHVILPGGLDMIAFECTSIEHVPEGLRQRQFLAHDFRSFVRTSADDLRALAVLVADKLNRSAHPATVILPLHGWSKADAPGGPYFAPEINAVFVYELKARLSPRVRVLEVSAHINDRECARVAVGELHSLMQQAAGLSRPGM
ncbi:MAG: Tm-1-like ATP-binding domain-containing protein [Thermodesulfobacteriota bacterium]